MVPPTGNPAIDRIPTGTRVTINSVPLTLCPTTDEQGTASLGNYCDAGAVQTNTVTGSFDPNGGSGDTAEQSEPYGDANDLTVNGSTRSGYTFGSWNTVSGGSGTSYTDGESYPFTASVPSTPYGPRTSGSPDSKRCAETYPSSVTKSMSASTAPTSAGSRSA
jgi:hypothetical protein